MIVLDEQLMGRGIEHDIAQWYGGSVRFVTDLRPKTVIKDDVIPALLRKLRQPTFVTINVRDFWQRVDIDPRFCVVCCDISDATVQIIPPLLRQLFRHDNFRTKRQRAGHVFRIDRNEHVRFYRHDDWRVQSFGL